MSLQEVLSYIDFNYYNCVLFAILFLQEHVKDFLSTLVCFLMSVTSVLAINYLSLKGFTFYEAAMFYEAGIAFSCIMLCLLTCRTGLIVFTVSCVGFFVNFVGYWIPNGEFYSYYQQSYGFIQIILFEVLVWGCIANSRLKPYITKWNKQLQESYKLKWEK